MANPPYQGTIYLDSGIITDKDPTTFVSLTDAGRGERAMFDRRINSARKFNAFLFNVKFSDGLHAEVQVNPEFETVDAARAPAEKYARAIGQLPNVLRTRVNTVWIHQGVEPFGGGNNNILIHVGQAELYQRDGILEETLIHEASHTSLEDHNFAAEWIEAQRRDNNFISTYAQQNPTREDVAESFLCYLAIRYLPDRISAANTETIVRTIPNRIAYFDKQNFQVYPLPPLPGNPFYMGREHSPLEYV
jgi:hypothetical protein